MGWLSGVLSGYGDRLGEIRKDNAARDLVNQQTEASIYNALLHHPTDQNIRQMAATGLFQMGQGRTRKGGLAGWMGEMQASPIYDTLGKYMTTEHPETTTTPGLPHTESAAGSQPLLPGQQPSGVVRSAFEDPPPLDPRDAGGPAYTVAPPPALAWPPDPNTPLAQPTTSPTQGGSMATPTVAAPTVTPPTVTPPPGFQVDRRANMVPRMPEPVAPPPAPPAAAAPAVDPTTTPAQGEPAQPLASSVPAALTGPPPAPPTASGPGRFYSQQVAGPAVGRTDTKMVLPSFPAPADAAAATEAAKMQAEVQQYQAWAKQAGDPNWQQAGIATYLQIHGKATMPFVETNIEFTDPETQKLVQRKGLLNKATGHYYEADGVTPMPQDAHAAPKAGGAAPRAFSAHEQMAAELFGQEGENPVVVDARLTPGQRQRVSRELNTRAAEAALEKANQVGTANLSNQARSQLTSELAKEATAIQKPQLEMKSSIEKMQGALGRFDQDPNGASQAVITTFEKILNPGGMVRQAAYERSKEYLSALDRVQGWWDRWVGTGDVDPTTGRWIGGGPGVPKDDLIAMAETARQFAVAQEHDNDGELARIAVRAQNQKLDPREIFGNSGAVPAPFGTPTPTPASPASPGGAVAAPKSAPGPEWQMIDGVLHHNGVVH